MPNRVIWLIEKGCPNRCIYCGNDGKKRYGLDQQRIKDIANQILQLGFREVIFAGGEPLYSDRFLQALEYLRGKIRVAIFTGGALGAKTKYLRSDGISRVVLSLDAGDERLNDRLRGAKGSTRAIIQAVLVLKERIDFSFNTVVSSLNVEHLPCLLPIISWAEPTSWSLTLVSNNFNLTPKDYFLDLPKLKLFYKKIVPQLALFADQENIGIAILPTPWVLREIPPHRWSQVESSELEKELGEYAQGSYNKIFYSKVGCLVVGNDITIGPEGEVYPCSQPSILAPEYSIGNIITTPLERIIMGVEMKTFIEKMPHPCCFTCCAPSNSEDPREYFIGQFR